MITSFLHRPPLPAAFAGRSTRALLTSFAIAGGAMLIALLVALTSLASPRPAAAAGCANNPTETWASPGVSGSWTSAANWSPSKLPGSTDNVCLPQGASAYTVTEAGNQTIASLEVDAGATLTINDAAGNMTFTVANDVTNAGAITLDGSGCSSTILALTSGTLHNSGALNLVGCPSSAATQLRGNLDDQSSGTVAVTGGQSQFLGSSLSATNNGAFSVATGATLGMSAGTFTQAAGTLTVDGALAFSGSATFAFNGGTISGSPTVVNGHLSMGGSGMGTVMIESGSAGTTLAGTIGPNQQVVIDGAQGNTTATASADVTNQGTLTLHNEGFCNIDTLVFSSGTLHNSGTVNLIACPTGANTQLQANLDNQAAGVVDVSGGTSQLLGGGLTFTNTGTFTVETGATLTVPSGNFVQAAGTLAINGTLSMLNNPTFTFNGGTITGTPVFSNGHIVMGGAGSGTLVVQSGGAGTTLSGTVGPLQQLVIDGSQGNTTVTASGDVTNDGTITLQGAVCWGTVLQMGTNTLHNAGALTFHGCTGKGATQLQGALDNQAAGTVTVADGEALFQSGGATIDNAGTFTIAPSALLYSNQAGVSFVNSGTLTIGPGAQLYARNDSFTNNSAGTLAFGISGATTFGLLDVTGGSIALGGTANPVLQGGFTPSNGASFQVIDGPHSGAFASVLGGFSADVSHAAFVDLVAGSGAALQITTTSLPGGQAGKLYNATLKATGGVQPYTWSLASGSSLPAGLSLDASSGVISGTPTASGPTSFTIDLSDSSSPKQTTSATLSIAIAPAALAVTTTTLPGGQVGVAYTGATLAASGGTPPYSWSLAAGSALPAGLSLSSNGTIGGTPTAAGTATFTVQVSDAATPAQTATANLSIAIAPAKLAIATSTLAGGIMGQPYAATLAGTGGTTPYTWSLASGSALPAGLSLNASSGAISGTPTTAGAVTFTIALADAGSPQQTATAQLTITIAAALTVTTSALPAGTTGQPYPATTLTAANGTPPYTWALAAGSALPQGLSLGTNGVIGGAPAAAGTTTFTVQVSDAGTPQQSAKATLRITVTAARSTRAYVVNGFSATVSVIDTGADKVVDTIPLPRDAGRSAQAAVASPDGTRLYVAYWGGVEVIDTATDKPLRQVMTLGAPDSLVINADGSRLYQLHLSTQGVVAIDTATFSTTVLLGAPFQFLDQHLVLSPDGTHLYENSGTNVWPIDLATGKRDTPFASDLFITGLAISPDGARIYVSGTTRGGAHGINGHHDGVEVLDAASGKVIASVDLGNAGPGNILPSPDGKQLYVAEPAAHSIAMIDVESDRILATVQLSSDAAGRSNSLSPCDLALDVESGRLYVSAESNAGADGVLAVVDTASRTQIDAVTVGRDPHGIVIATASAGMQPAANRGTAAPNAPTGAR